jgi:hypothetical protein
MSSKSGVYDQVISPPKGGGVPTGLGENFSPDLHTGTGNFTVFLTAGIHVREWASPDAVQCDVCSVLETYRAANDQWQTLGEERSTELLHMAKYIRTRGSSVWHSLVPLPVASAVPHIWKLSQRLYWTAHERLAERVPDIRVDGPT